MGKLTNRVAIITGGASGMGEGVARVFAREGAKVVILDQSELGMKVVDDLITKGFQSLFYQVDVRDRSKLDGICSEVMSKYGSIDILVNAAGIGTQAPFKEADGQLLKDMMEINFHGIWNTCQAVIPYMDKASVGKIVNFASVTGVLVVDPCMTAYAASKGAIMGLTKALAVEFAPQGIHVNAILPGMVRTPMTEKSSREANSANPELVLAGLAKTVPMGRLGTSEEAGKVALFLASEESNYVTGTSIVFDGGSTLPESLGSGWQPT